MMDENGDIRGGFYLKKLFEIQSELLVKPVRFLTRAHVEPTNLEKMKVCRATQIFSPPVIATLQFLQDNPSSHPDAHEFENSSPTINFMKMVAKWYALHDIGKVQSSGLHDGPFIVTDDERLSWLELDFVCYMEDLRMHSDRSKRMTKETYEATLLTTKSTLALIEFLLDHVNFRYVLTRGLTATPWSHCSVVIGSLMAAMTKWTPGRQFTLWKKLLKVGILQAAKSGNAPASSEMKAPIRMTVQNVETYPLPAPVVFATRELASEIEFVNRFSEEADIKIAPVAFLAGYVARVCVEKVPCRSCKALLQAEDPSQPIYGLLKYMDNGNLTYPKTDVVGLCKLTCNFVSRVMKSEEVRRSSQLCKMMLSALLPHFTRRPQLICESRDSVHTEKLCKVFLIKLLRPLLANWAGDINSTVERLLRLSHKPL
ncbi:hypothetical protein HPB48_007327 [Haemaphysalis longicornis]|uniref:Transposable element P transposase-like GTP-binding insertion domain-containing protein n=1 Tax=Haemaphysalis longicornis TaxID=44386 RepID=A0A9J6GKU4_HAELO|nr:hypothetical protein HPB48_007327 [Haemaphysalis longicornis]